MIIKIVGLLIGILVAVFGIYYLAKDSKDPESRKIYGIAAAIGVLIVIGCILALVL